MPTPAQITDRLWAERGRADAKAPDLVDPKFPHQTAMLEDSASLLVGFCTRRASKSYTAIKRLLRAMHKHPGCSTLFLGLTRETAKRVVWKDTLRVLNRDLKLGGRFNKVELSFTLPNGSVLYILGVDADDGEKEKLLGQKYAEVAIDESASYTIDLEELVYGVLKPAVADYRGVIGLYGTPGNLKSGLFFDLTNGKDPSKPERWTKRGWSGHCWSTLQNPHMADKWREEIAELIRDNPLIESTPTFRQNYLGLWVIDETKLVYRYLPTRNDYDGRLPIYARGAWHYVLAIDLGWEDPCSFTVLAYHDHDRTLYGVTSFKPSKKLDLTDVAAQADALKSQYPIDTTVVDGANKQAVMEMNRRMGLEAIAADKRDKFDFIDIMNDEFIQERIRLSPDCADLKAEYAALVVDEKKLAKRKREEHPRCDNHCADGALYGWRWCWQYLSVIPKEAPKHQSPAWYVQQQAAAEDEMAQMMESQFARNKDDAAAQREVDEWG